MLVARSTAQQRHSPQSHAFIVHSKPAAPTPPPLHTHTHTTTTHTTPPEAEVDPDEEPELVAQLVWAHTPTYPDEAPSIRLRSVKGLGDAELQEATRELTRHIEVWWFWGTGGLGRGSHSRVCRRKRRAARGDWAAAATHGGVVNVLVIGRHCRWGGTGMQRSRPAGVHPLRVSPEVRAGRS